MRIHLLTLCILLIHVARSPADEAALVLVKKIVLKGGEGRLDHFGLDAKHNRLFASNRGAVSLDVIDLHASKLIEQILEQKKISGIAYAPSADRIFGGNQDPGVCNVFDGKTYKLLKSLKIPGADNVQFDPRTNLIYVGGAGLTVVDAKTLEVKAEIATPGKLKAFRIDATKPKLYANSTSTEVCVIDTERLKELTRYPITGVSGNASLAVDSTNRRIFVGCRNKPTLIVLNADTGKEVSRLEIPGSVDDLSFDAKRRRVYASSGEGVVVVIQASDADRYSLAATIPTVSHAQTSIFDSQHDKFYLGVPGDAGKSPKVWVYEPRP